MIPIRAIPKYKGNETTHSDMADNIDIRRAIFGAVPEANEQVKEMAKYFGRSSQRESCKAIFDFLKQKINYVADGELQLIKLPSALLHTKVGDCKSYSLFTSAILTNLGIPHHFVLVSYNGDPTPSHIYVATDDGCIIDAVWGIFDSEKKPTYRYEIKPNGKMRVKSISGIGKCGTYMAGCGCGCNSCGVTGVGIGADRPNSKAEVNSYCENKFKGKSGRIKTCKGYWNAINWGEKAASNVAKGATTIGFAAGRNLFLVIMKANLDGFASKVAKMDWGKVSSLWKKVGGDPSALKKAMEKGASKPAKKLGLLGMLKKKAGIKGIGSTENTLKALIPATATAVGTAINPAGGTAAGASLGSVLVAMLPIVLQALQMLSPADTSDTISSVSLGTDELSNSDVPATDTTGDGGSSGNSNMTTYLLLGGAALVGAYFIFGKKGSKATI